jgi:ubiquinone/menaquinone biosynthesis C-methylase UbiE
MIDSKRLYDKRFSTFERIRKQQLWKILCEDFLQKFIKPEDIVLDIGAGHCEFINSISCGKKIALDSQKDFCKYSNSGVSKIVSSVKNLRKLFKNDSIDVIFMSNFLEHLDSKEDVFRLLNECYMILRKQGRLLIMQPDIGLVGHKYWDFFDHKVPITCASLVEVLKADNFTIKYLRFPFLPYSTKVRFFPLWPPLLKIYLKFRPLQYIFGKQFFVCAEK